MVCLSFTSQPQRHFLQEGSPDFLSQGWLSLLCAPTAPQKCHSHCSIGYTRASRASLMREKAMRAGGHVPFLDVTVAPGSTVPQVWKLLIHTCLQMNAEWPVNLWVLQCEVVSPAHPRLSRLSALKPDFVQCLSYSHLLHLEAGLRTVFTSLLGPSLCTLCSH